MEYTMLFAHRNSWVLVSCVAAMYLCIAEHTVNAQSSEISLGSFTTRMHNVAGDVVLLSERALEVRGFVYDGEAPAVYFWADTNAVPSNAGYRLNDGSPNNGCGVSSLPVEADGTVTYRVEFPDGKTINDLLGGSISLWCEAFSVSFGEVIIPSTLDGVPATSSGPDLECSANVDETPVAPNSVPVSTPTKPDAAPVSLPKSAPVSVPALTPTTTSDSISFGLSVGFGNIVATTMIMNVLRLYF